MSERAALAIEKVELFKSQKAVEATTAFISRNEGELNAARVALAAVKANASVNIDDAREECKAATAAKMAAVRAQCKAATEAELAAVRVEAYATAAAAQVKVEKATKDEFRASFFQGYSDLKMRVSMDHPEWDLSTYLGLDSD